MAYRNQGFNYVPAYAGDEGLVLRFEEGAAQTFTKGEPVQLASGLVIVAAASPMGANTLTGFAEEDASGVTNNLLRVRVPRLADTFIADYGNAQTFVIADVDETGYDIEEEGSTGIWKVDQGTQTNPKVLVLGSLEYNIEGTLVATAGGSVYVKFLGPTTLFGIHA